MIITIILIIEKRQKWGGTREMNILKEAANKQDIKQTKQRRGRCLKNLLPKRQGQERIRNSGFLNIPFLSNSVKTGRRGGGKGEIR